MDQISNSKLIGNWILDIGNYLIFMENDPLVTIILPVLNSSEYLRACLESIISQSHTNLEVIAMDDFSNDESAKILREYRKNDKRIRVYRNKKRYGLSVCLNRALKKAKGDFITFMNPNDSMSRQRIKRQVNFLLENPKAVAVGTQSVFLNHKNKRIGESDFPKEHDIIYKKLPTGSSILFEAVMIDKRMIPKDLLKFSSNSYPFVFIDVFMKLFNYGNISNLPEFLYFQRKNIMNKSYKELETFEHFLEYIKLLLKSIIFHDYKPSIHSIRSPFSK